MSAVEAAERGCRARGDGEAIDAEVRADAVDDENSPAEVDDDGEEEVSAEVVEFSGGGESGTITHQLSTPTNTKVTTHRPNEGRCARNAPPKSGTSIMVQYGKGCLVRWARMIFVVIRPKTKDMVTQKRTRF